MADLKNLDLETLEALLQSQGGDLDGNHKGEDRQHKKKKHRSSKSRSRSRSHKKKSRKRSKSKSQSRKKDSRKRSKSRSKDRKESRRKRSRSRDKEKARDRDRKSRDRDHKSKSHNNEDDNIDLETIEKRQKERIEREEEERKKQESKQMEEKLAEAKRQLEEARRDDSTVLVLNLCIKSQEKDIYEFFSKSGCGKVRDIRVVRDPRSGKSKGVAYVEFYALESVNKAVGQTGKELQGSKLKVLPSKAEINRTAAAAKQLKQTKNPAEQQHNQATGGMRIFVSGLTDNLADIEEKDLRDLFSPFGEVDKVDIHRDDVTGKSKGYAFLLFRNSGDARRAIIEMDNFVVNGKKIKVQPMQAGMANMFQDNSNFDLEDESGSNYLQTSQSRAILMQKLQRDPTEGPLDPNAMGLVANPEPVQPVKPQTSLLPTKCLLMSNMFDMSEVDLNKDPGYFVDLKEEIEEECKNYGDIEQSFIEATKDGNIWLKFKEGRGASTAYQTLNNKFFSGRKIICSYVTETTFNSKLRDLHMGE